jgi:hypothetical protein
VKRNKGIGNTGGIENRDAQQKICTESRARRPRQLRFSTLLLI